MNQIHYNYTPIGLKILKFIDYHSRMNTSKFWEESIPLGFYDIISKEGVVNGKGLQSFWHLQTYKQVSSYIIDSKIHLDYACGSGFFINYCKNKNSLGVDISINQIEYAKKTYPEYDFYSLSDFDISAHGPFDTVTAIGLLEYLTDDEIHKLLGDLLSNIKSGGKVIFTTPNYNLSMKFIEFISYTFGGLDYRTVNINQLTKKKAINIFEQHKAISIKIKKIHNSGVLFSIFNHKLAGYVENFLERLFKNKFGFLLMIVIEKNE